MSLSPDLLECLAGMRTELVRSTRILDGLIAVTMDHQAGASPRVIFSRSRRGRRRSHSGAPPGYSAQTHSRNLEFNSAR